MNITETAQMAKAASIQMAAVKTNVKNRALAQIARTLKRNSDKIVSANKKDLEEAQKNNLSAPLLKRLKFDENKLTETIAGVKSLIKLDDPVGKILSATELDQGLELYKVSCPIGVIGIIFEFRPDALVQISTLCLKSGNAVLLKGGSEAANTNRTLAEIIAAAGDPSSSKDFRLRQDFGGRDGGQDAEAGKASLPKGWLQLLETRQEVAEMLALDEYVDLIIPRGSNEFVRYIMDNTNIPVLGHAEGICHVYIDKDADFDMAVKIVVDSKCQYAAVCNAAETLLVDAKIANKFLPIIKDALEQKQVEIRGCEKTAAIFEVKPAKEEDWSTEYLDLIISIKVVDGLDEAIEHINKYGSGHTDAIVTDDRDSARKFMALVDSANVFWNCSTRFSDGYRYGLGAEVGISTNKIHARGPVGLEGLVIYKWKLYGSGQIVADYCGPDAKKFKHKKISH
jgi:glutamate-5-semialdehyde dehydrogenase